LGQQLERIQHQIAAIGPMQGAGADHGEVRNQCAHLGLMLYPTDQVGVMRQRFDDHRRSVRVAMID